jgi:hypothetical protein
VVVITKEYFCGVKNNNKKQIEIGRYFPLPSAFVRESGEVTRDDARTTSYILPTESKVCLATSRRESCAQAKTKKF